MISHLNIESSSASSRKEKIVNTTILIKATSTLPPSSSIQTTSVNAYAIDAFMKLNLKIVWKIRMKNPIFHFNTKELCAD